MKLAATTFVTIALMGALCWRPVCMTDPNPPPPGPVCPENYPNLLPFRISVLDDAPFAISSPNGRISGIVADFFLDIVKKCFIRECNVTLESFQYNVFNTTSSFLESVSNSEADMAFPISRPLMMWLSGDTYKGPPLKFDDIIKSPGYSLIMDVGIFNGKANDLVMTNLMQDTWPIIAFIVLLAGISGICVWMLETYFNEEEFPRSFTKGSYEGFWWAFVSMTTVGYGDKTPKFVFGRIFGVLWILTGLVVIAIFTATATSALSISASELSALEGAKIGVLDETPAELEAKQRGAIVEVLPSVQHLFSDLKKDKINGVFMDKYKAAYHLKREGDPNLKVFESFPVDVNYYIALKDSQFAKDVTDDKACFDKLIERLDVDDLIMQYLPPVAAYNEDSDSISIFSGKSPSTKRFLLTTMGIFLGLVLLGVIAEILFRKLWKPTKKVQSREEQIDLKEVRIQPLSVSRNLKEVEEKVGQLVREVSKLQEQLTMISSQANGTFRSGGTTTHI